MSSLDVIFTKHAKERLAERAEDWRKVPLDKIRRSAFCHGDGKFTVRQSAISYICKLENGDRIIVITVIKYLNKPKKWAK